MLILEVVVVRSELKEDEKAWLDANEKEINQDYVGPTEWPLSSLSDAQLEERMSDHSWEEHIAAKTQDSSIIDKANSLDPLERVVMTMKYCDNMSERQIASAIIINIMVNDKVIKASNCSRGMIEVAIRKAKIKLSSGFKKPTPL